MNKVISKYSKFTLLSPVNKMNEQKKKKNHKRNTTDNNVKGDLIQNNMRKSTAESA